MKLPQLWQKWCGNKKKSKQNSSAVVDNTHFLNILQTNNTHYLHHSIVVFVKFQVLNNSFDQFIFSDEALQEEILDQQRDRIGTKYNMFLKIFSINYI